MLEHVNNIIIYITYFVRVYVHSYVWLGDTEQERTFYVILWISELGLPQSEDNRFQFYFSFRNSYSVPFKQFHNPAFALFVFFKIIRLSSFHNYNSLLRKHFRTIDSFLYFHNYAFIFILFPNFIIS